MKIIERTNPKAHRKITQKVIVGKSGGKCDSASENIERAPTVQVRPWEGRIPIRKPRSKFKFIDSNGRAKLELGRSHALTAVLGGVSAAHAIAIAKSYGPEAPPQPLHRILHGPSGEYAIGLGKDLSYCCNLH